MKITIDVKSFLEAFSKLTKIVKTRSFNPILEAIYFKKLDDNRLLLVGATHTAQGYAIVPAEFEDEETDFLINAGVMYELVKNFKDEEKVIFKVEDNFLNITTSSAKYKINVSPTENYIFKDLPNNTTENNVIIPFEVMSRIAQSVAFATNNDTSDVMNGVLLEIFEGNAKINAVASDNFRLSVLEAGVVGVNSQLEKIIIPKDIILKISEFYKNKDVKIMFEEKQIMCVDEDESFIFVARLLVGEFPNYRAIIPNEKNLEVKVSKSILLKRLKAIAPLLGEGEDKVIFEISDNMLTIGISNQYLGDAEGVVPLIEKNGENMKIAFSFKHLFEGLNAFKSDVITFKFQGSQSVVLLEEENFIYLIVPMMLEE